MAIGRLDFNLLKTFPIEHLLRARGLLSSCRLRGNRIVGPCPIHGGDNPNAFVVTRSRNLWYCFSQCQAGGDVIDLFARIDGVDRIEAARRLSSTYELQSAAPPRQPRYCQRQNTAAFRPFTNRLELDPTATLLARKAIRPSTARFFEAGAWRGRGWLAGCVAVRLRDPDAQPLGYAGRRLERQQAITFGKWKMPPRLPKNDILYAWHIARHRLHLPLAIVECPWGVMRLHQIGLPAVALLGTALSGLQHKLIATAPRIMILLDGDPAGRRATERIARRLNPGPVVRTVYLRDHCDPDDLSDAQLASIIRPLFP